MSAISWAQHETFSGTPAFSLSTASSGDDYIRSLLTTIATGLGESFYWPGSAASQGSSISSSGEQLLGTLRMAHTSNTGGGFGDGFLGFNTTVASVYHIGSTWTGLLGGANMLDANGGFTLPSRTRWLVQEGAYTSSGTTNSVSFPSAYSVAPNVYLWEGVTATLHDKNSTFYAFGLSTVTAGGFTSTESALAGSSSASASYYWRSEGTAAY